MRILHVVTNSDLGGAPRVVTELANSAVRDGHTVAAASVPEGPFWAHLDADIERIYLKHLRREISPIQDISALFELSRLYRTWRPDIIHLHSSKVGVLGRIAAGSRLNRVIYTIHGFDTILKSYRAFLALERVLARNCGAVVPVSMYDQANLEKSGILGRIAMIPNGASDRRGAVPSNVAAADRMKKAKAAGQMVVLTIARLARPKRFDLFIEAAKAMKPEEVRFFWIGNVEAVDPSLLPANVEMLGELPEAGDYANLCDFFVLFSDYEGMPMSIIEALSAGKPIIASRVGGIGEMVDSSIGILVENQAAAVIDAIRSILEDRTGLEARARAARIRYESGYSADIMWTRYSALYADVLSRSQG